MSRPSEDDLIARYFAPLATAPGADGLRDDAAIFTPPFGSSIVITADALVESVHFLPGDPAGTIARKALRVNLSDLAAKGAQPYAFLLSLALPGDWTEPWLAAFAAGLRQDCEEFGIALLGGDTVRTPGPLTISVTALGLVAGTAIPRRSGARVGDLVYVTGTIGDGALGLAVRRGVPTLLAALTVAQQDWLMARYLIPQPRVGLAGAVLACGSAAMDISDGFAGDLAKLCRVSGCSARIDVAAIPLSAPASAAVVSSDAFLDLALTAGDDYEILVTVPPARQGVFEGAAQAAGVPVARVGEIVEGRSPPVFQEATGKNREFSTPAFSHF